jgi:hypothetical protein
MAFLFPPEGGVISWEKDGMQNSSITAAINTFFIAVEF